MRSDNLLDINLKLSKDVTLYVIVLPLSSSFLTGTEKAIDFPVFSPKHSNLSSNHLAISLIIK